MVGGGGLTHAPGCDSPISMLSGFERWVIWATAVSFHINAQGDLLFYPWTRERGYRIPTRERWEKARCISAIADLIAYFLPPLWAIVFAGEWLYARRLEVVDQRIEGEPEVETRRAVMDRSLAIGLLEPFAAFGLLCGAGVAAAFGMSPVIRAVIVVMALVAALDGIRRLRQRTPVPRWIVRS